jgi:protoheme IX farnesyltransferase
MSTQLGSSSLSRPSLDSTPLSRRAVMTIDRHRRPKRATGRGAWMTRLADYLELTKPRIVVLELLVAGVAACVAKPRAMDLWLLLHALGGTALVAASASVANSWIERRRDAWMKRTAQRPLPTGRVSALEALVLSALTLVLGAGWLLWQVGGLTALLGMTSWSIYVMVYTPLKTRTSLNTAIGAVAGAIPVLMGWTATGAPLSLTPLSLAAVVFLWQFPHFMAIAWLYADDYAAAGHKMLSVIDPSGIRSGLQALVGALLLIPVSLVPALAPTNGSPLVYGLWTVGLGLVQLALAMHFAMRRDEASARRLLRVTLLYLPAWMVVLLLVTV